MREIRIPVEHAGIVHAIPVPADFSERFETLYAEYGPQALAKVLTDLANCENRFCAVGKKYKRSYERMRQIYYKILAPHFEPTGRSRYRAYTETRAHGRLPAATQAVWREAERSGCTVRHVNRICENSNDITTLYCTLSINGHLCRIRHLRNKAVARLGQRHTYSHTTIRRDSLKAADYQIFFVDVPGVRQSYYIVPSSVLTQKSDSRSLSVYIPLSRRSPHDHPLRKTNWHEYRDAWHLLVSEKTAA